MTTIRTSRRSRDDPPARRPWVSRADLRIARAAAAERLLRTWRQDSHATAVWDSEGGRLPG